MPTAAEYRQIATELAVARDAVRSLLQPVVDAVESAPFDGGDLDRAFGATFAVTTANVDEVVAELARQIDESTRRARVCDRYADAVSWYRRSNDPDASWPKPPASWVEW